MSHYQAWVSQPHDYDAKADTVAFCICNYPFLLNPVGKSKLLLAAARSRMALRRLAQPDGPKQLEINVSRDDCLNGLLLKVKEQLGQCNGTLLMPMRVSFSDEGEEGIDLGGLRVEFMELLAAELARPELGLLDLDEETGTYFFSAQEGDDADLLAFTLGAVVGLACLNGITLDLPLSPALYRVLLGYTLRGLEDLNLVQPGVARSLRHVLKYKGDVEDLCLSWTVTVPNKSGI